LFGAGILVFLFIILIAIAGDICIRILKSTSELIVEEFNELQALQDVKYRVSQASYFYGKSPADTVFHESDPDGFIHVMRSINHCRSILTHRHNRSELDLIEKNIILLEKINHKDTLIQDDLASNRIRPYTMASQYQRIIISTLDRLILETNKELDEYVKINETAIVHSRLTIVSLGTIMAIVVIIGGFLFIRRLTYPLEKMVSAIREVSGGNLTAKVMVQSQDEFQVVADSFNAMLDRIDQITVSRDFYDNILNSMLNGMIVCDNDYRITAINHSALKLFNSNAETYWLSELKSLFVNPLEYDELINNAETVWQTEQFETTITAADGCVLPCLILRSRLNNSAGSPIGKVFIFHDLTENRKMEQALEAARKERIVAMNEAVERERIRIARDLHDGLGQVLTSVSYSIQKLQSGANNAVSSTNLHILDLIREDVTMAISETKRIARDLIPLELADFGLIPAITKLIENMNLCGKTQFSFIHYGFENRIDSRIEKILYRVCQELLNNVLKHAGARKTDVQLVRHDDSVVMVIEDDGQGFLVTQPENNPAGIGLPGIRERISILGGTVLINSELSVGTEVIIEIPCLTKHE